MKSLIKKLGKKYREYKFRRLVKKLAKKFKVDCLIRKTKYLNFEDMPNSKDTVFYQPLSKKFLKEFWEK